MEEVGIYPVVSHVDIRGQKLLNSNILLERRRKKEMKKAFAVMMMVLFLAGCGAAARESGFYEHNTMYRDWDHLKFSISGYKTVEPEELKMSKANDWWGKTVDSTK
jgi:hypothetical protein